MKKLYYKKFYLIIVFIVSVFTISGISQTYITGGAVSGTWTSSTSPYYIQGEITIPDSQVLTIEPGVDVVFMGHYKFNVQGRLLAVGTQVDSIRFTAANTDSGWHGVRFNYTPATNDTSKIIYCSFRNGKANTGTYTGPDRCGGSIFVKGFSKVLISNSLFENNMNNGDINAATGGAAIYVGNTNSIIISNSTFLNNVGTTDCSILSINTNSIITNNVFSNNSGPHGPVFCINFASVISGNIFSYNMTTRAGGGIFNMTTTDTVTNNIIIYNQCFGGEGEGGGIKCWINDKSVIVNNTIAFNSASNGGAICCNVNSDPIFINNIIWGNTSPNGNQVNLVESTSDPVFVYCDIQGGKEEFGGIGADSNYTGLYENNIDSDPLFLDTTSFDFRLMEYSPCIGSGIDSTEIAGIWYYAPPFCFYGGPRPNPSNSNPDIGACENPNPFPVDVEQDLTRPTEFVLDQNYPNPFNPSTKISWQSPVGSWQTLKIFDILGNEIATLVDEYKPVGSYEVQFNASTLPSGVYFYQLKVGNFIQTKKMLLLK